MKSNKGMTLIEIMVALAISAIVIGGAMYGMQILRNATNVESDRIYGDLEQRAVDISNTAKSFANLGPSMYFMHLPIPVKCSKNEPCLRKLEGNAFVDYTSANVTPTNYSKTVPSIPFYHDSVMVDTEPFGANKPFVLKASSPLVFDKTIADYYATWPLINETSKPFLGFVQNTDNDHSYHLELIRVVKGTATNNKAIVRTTGGKLKASNIENTMFVLYQVGNRQFFSIKKISEGKATDCSVDLSKCERFVCVDMSTGGTNYCSGSVFTVDAKKQFTKEGSHFLVDLEPVNSGRFLDPFDKAGITNFNWPNQTNFAYFPTKAFSLNKTTSTTDLSYLSGFLHAFDEGIGTPSPINLSPIAAVYYDLKKQTDSSSNKEFYSLMESKYDVKKDEWSSKNIIYQAKENDDSAIYFARKLGSNNLNLFYK